MSELSLILSTPSATGILEFRFGPVALADKEAALAHAALVGAVRTPAENMVAVEAQKYVKQVALSFERERKKLKEPLIEAGRRLDRMVGDEIKELDIELGRLSNLTTEFQLAEQRRIREEQEAQARELARIEAEKQAELKRIADEQARVEREAREAREAAERAAREATNKAQREAAAKAMAEAEAARKAAEQSAAVAAAQTARVEATASAATYAESKPITVSRESGQVVKTEWEITVTNPYELAKFHPDCVTITPLLTPIKAALNEGRTVKGVVAKKILTTSVRPGAQKFIDV